MKKHASAHHTPHTPTHSSNPLLPIVTLGFYGLRRFRPHWLYVTVALLVLGGWACFAYYAGTVQAGMEYVLAPLVFVMAIVTFFRIVPPGAPRGGAHRTPTHR